MILKASPKIYTADAAIRNAVLMIDINDLIANPEEMGLVAETVVYKHVNTFSSLANAQVGYYRKSGRTAKEIDVVVDQQAGKTLIEVKYQEKLTIKQDDAIFEVDDSAKERILAALVVTKKAEAFGKLPFKTKTPIYQILAYAFLYLLGHAEECGYLAGRQI